MKGSNIRTLFKAFYQHFSYLELEQAVEYFSILGGVEESVELDYFDDVFSMVESNFVHHFTKFQTLVSPSYLLEAPYREVLMSAARGDGKFYSVVKKARLSEGVGEKIIQELISLDILWLEHSREAPLKIHPKHKLKKELRSYRRQDKLRFVEPFMRFWFGFVMYYAKELSQGESSAFLENFQRNYERLRSLVYEQLCDALLVKHYQSSAPLLSSGSYWDQHSEFDILAVTSDKKLILGECKYKNRKVCKNELSKLKAKALHSGIKVDIYALFSKDGFSNELLQTKEKNLLLFDLNDLKQLLQEEE